MLVRFQRRCWELGVAVGASLRDVSASDQIYILEKCCRSQVAYSSWLAQTHEGTRKRV